jgi:hypothetical protein
VNERVRASPASLDASLLLLSEHFGWDLGAYTIANAKSARSREEAAADAARFDANRTEVERANHLDVRLYAFAKQLHTQQLRQLHNVLGSAEFKRRLARIRAA